MHYVASPQRFSKGQSTYLPNETTEQAEREREIHRYIDIDNIDIDIEIEKEIDR